MKMIRIVVIQVKYLNAILMKELIKCCIIITGELNYISEGRVNRSLYA